jgi:hypothetical protein
LSHLEMMEDNETAIEIMLNHPPEYPFDPIYNRYPLDLHLIADLQASDLELQRFIVNNDQFKISKIINWNIINHRPRGSQGYKIVIPMQLQHPSIRWMHSLLGHPGIDRLYNTLAPHF